ncbi:hypothetical protein J6590_072709 [Homalodisca vitripennis]|nr:hypothetical protein J6590_072709 [Homalodisca vitripennis]
MTCGGVKYTCHTGLASPLLPRQWFDNDAALRNHNRVTYRAREVQASGRWRAREARAQTRRPGAVRLRGTQHLHRHRHPSQRLRAQHCFCSAAPLPPSLIRH